jgi:diacylglycerol O-acyltransferase / wax synthase
MTGARHAVRPVDDVWLAMDQPDNLMVVEGLMVLDGELDRDTYVRLLRERVLDRFPRFRQRVRHAWLPWPGQWWEDDPSFDLDRHVREVRLPAPGDDAALEDHVASSLSRALDRQHPPWEVHLVQGYVAGTAIYTRLHHALADGTALLRVILSLADEEVSEADDDRPGLLEVARSTVRALPGTARLLRTPMVAQHLLLASRPASPLSVPPHHGKRAVWTPSIDVADLRELRRATGTTVTDVVMAAVAGALRRWLLDHGADPMVDDLPTMVPVDLRGSAALRADDLGNQFALVLLDLPVGLDSPLGRLDETAARMRAIKDSPEAWLTYGLLEGMGLVHPRLRVHATDFFARKATGVTTSVRGPDQPLHLAGLPVTRLWAWAPMSADQSLSTSIVGYAGSIHVGFKVDSFAVPDPQSLVTGLQAEIAQLTALARHA